MRWGRFNLFFTAMVRSRRFGERARSRSRVTVIVGGADRQHAPGNDGSDHRSSDRRRRGVAARQREHPRHGHADRRADRDDGRYTIRGVKPGTVDLQVTRIGYAAKHFNTAVAAGGTAAVTSRSPRRRSRSPRW